MHKIGTILRVTFLIVLTASTVAYSYADKSVPPHHVIMTVEELNKTMGEPIRKYKSGDGSEKWIFHFRPSNQLEAYRFYVIRDGRVVGRGLGPAMVMN